MIVRLNVVAETSIDELPIDYRRKIVSFIKGAFEEYDTPLFEALYQNSGIKKNFTFAAYFGGDAVIGQEVIQFPQKRIFLTFSTPDVALGLHIYNALATRRGKERPLADCGTVRITRINKLPERTRLPNNILCKALSPIVIRDHKPGTDGSWYYAFNDSDFMEMLRRNLLTELQGGPFRYLAADAKNLTLEPVRMKKTVIKSYDAKIPASLGIFRLEGPPALLQYLYMSGVGGRRGLGFGCIDLL